MGSIKTIRITVDIQENGIIRNEKGYLIARLSDSADFDGEHVLGISNKYSGFEFKLRRLLNEHSMENQSNTPDFILAEYLLNCLSTWNMSIEERDRWYRFEPFKPTPKEPSNG